MKATENIYRLSHPDLFDKLAGLMGSLQGPPSTA